MDAQLAGICSDFYVNQKLALTMDVPEGREAVLDLFGRIKKEFPWLERLRRYEGEYALESEDVDGTYEACPAALLLALLAKAARIFVWYRPFQLVPPVAIGAFLLFLIRKFSIF